MRKDTILHYIKEYAETQPDVLAVCELKKTLSYKEYWEAIRRAATVLMNHGIVAKQHVILRCTQDLNYLVFFSALQYIGALPVPIEKKTAPERISEIARAVDASILISDKPAQNLSLLVLKELAAELEDAEPADCVLGKADDESMLLFTTGTTGTSKGVLMTHLGDVTIAENVLYGTEMKKGNVEILPMPLNHSFATRRYQTNMVNGGTVCLMDGMAFIGTLWKLIEKYKATSMALSPATLGMIFKLSGDRIAEYEEQLDFIQLGSAPLSETDKQHLLRILPSLRMYNLYGSSEAGCACILNFNSEDDKVGCIGHPTCNSLVRFTDMDGNIVDDASPENPALLSWGGPIVMKAYYNAPELTAETVKDGYVATKDLAYLDEEGRCILVGRADDIINYGGSKISPAEVEDIAKDYPGIADCALAGMKDDITGELPVMLVVKADGYDELEFAKFLEERVESYKLPHKYFYVEEIPRTFKGSILRKEIKSIMINLQ